MSLPECKEPFCGCDFEKADYDKDTSYCTDKIEPKFCMVPEKACKYSGIRCKHTIYYENDEDEENPLCMALREGITECPFKVYEPEGVTWTLQETITNSPHWNLRGFKYFHGMLLVDEKIIRAIKNWAADCGEPACVGSYNNQEAMFNALDMIYKLLDEAERGPVTITNKDVRGEGPEILDLKQITSINNQEKR